MNPVEFIMFNLRALRSSDAKRLWRQTIFERDGHRCVYCGSNEHLTIDHLVPKCRGGKTTDENCVTACRACNQAKGSLSLQTFIFESST